MSDWITDRRPTKEDADVDGCVWIAVDDFAALSNWHHDNDCPWQPTNRPEPYVPPKPVRREWGLSLQPRDGGETSWQDGTAFLRQSRSAPISAEDIHVREVLPGDPTPETIEEVANDLDVIAKGESDTIHAVLCILAHKLRGSDVQ